MGIPVSPAAIAGVTRSVWRRRFCIRIVVWARSTFDPRLFNDMVRPCRATPLAAPLRARSNDAKVHRPLGAAVPAVEPQNPRPAAPEMLGRVLVETVRPVAPNARRRQRADLDLRRRADVHRSRVRAPRFE